MAELSARQIALTALRLWRKEKHFADFIISGLLTKTQLNASVRGFALELFCGVLRNLTLLDFWIGCVRASGIDRDLRDILRFGLYQLLCLRTPEHAAVHETVELAAKKQRNVVNAILRTATRQRSELLARAAAQPLLHSGPQHHGCVRVAGSKARRKDSRCNCRARRKDRLHRATHGKSRNNRSMRPRPAAYRHTKGEHGAPRCRNCADSPTRLDRQACPAADHISGAI